MKSIFIKTAGAVGMWLGFSLAAQAQTAQFQFIHNSADPAASNIDVWLGNMKVASNLSFRQATPMMQVNVSTANQLRIKAGGSMDTANPIFFRTVGLAPGTRTAFVATGVLDPTQFANNPEAASILFDIKAIPVAPRVLRPGAPDSTTLTPFHGITDAPSIKLRVRKLGDIVRTMAYGTFADPVTVPSQSLAIDMLDPSGVNRFESFGFPMQFYRDSSVTLLASGFLTPSANQNGPLYNLIMVTAGGNVRNLDRVAAPADARVQFINAISDTSVRSIRIFQDGVARNYVLNYQEATPFIEMGAERNIRIAIVRNGMPDTIGALAQTEWVFFEGSRSTMLISGLTAGSNYLPNPSGRSTRATVTRYPANNPSRGEQGVPVFTDLHFINAVTDSRALDVFLRGNRFLWQNVNYGDGSNYTTLNATNHVIDVLENNRTFASYNLPLINLGDSVFTLVATGFRDSVRNSNGPAFDLLLVHPSGLSYTLSMASAMVANANVQIIHNSPDVAASEVDVWINGRRVLDDMAFRTATPYMPIAAEVPMVISITGRNSTDTINPIYRQRVTLMQNGTYQLIASGLVSSTGYSPNPSGRNTSFMLAMVPNAMMGRGERAGQPDSTGVMFVHGATDVPAINVSVGSMSNVWNNFAYGDMGMKSLPSMNTNLMVNVGPATIGNFQADLSNYSDSVVTILASGFADPAANMNGQPAGLLLVTAGGRAMMLPLVASNKVVLAKGVRAYPNPANGHVQIEGLRSNEAVQYSLYNLQGRMVASGKLGENGKLMLNRQQLTAGTYQLVLHQAGTGAQALRLNLE